MPISHQSSALCGCGLGPVLSGCRGCSEQDKSNKLEITNEQENQQLSNKLYNMTNQANRARNRTRHG